MKRYSRTGAALATATLSLATVFLVAGGSVSQAKPQKAEKSPKAAFTAMQSGGGKPAEGLDAATTAAIGKGEDGSLLHGAKEALGRGRRLDRPPGDDLPLRRPSRWPQEKSPGSRRGFRLSPRAGALSASRPRR